MDQGLVCCFCLNCFLSWARNTHWCFPVSARLYMYPRTCIWGFFDQSLIFHIILSNKFYLPEYPVDPCSLTCVAVSNHRRIEHLSDVVPDGTQCFGIEGPTQYQGVCLNGQCLVSIADGPFKGEFYYPQSQLLLHFPHPGSLQKRV